MGRRAMTAGHARTVFATTAELASQVDRELGCSPWIEIDQRRIDLFAEASGDRQWIHVDPARAASGPFGTTVAHGFLTLGLLPEMQAAAFEIGDARLLLNYGLNKVRFPAAVPVGSWLRGRLTLRGYAAIEGGAQLTIEVVVEREAASRPVCVAEVLIRCLLQ